MNTVKTKVLVSAILSIVLCVSLIAGATFALFTSESNVNIAVTSGKVDVVASVDETSVQTKQLDKDYVDGIENTYGGGIVIADGNITIPNIVPGDGIKFSIKVENNSTIAIKYRTVITCTDEDGLLDGLKVEIDNESYKGRKIVSKWQTLVVEQDPSMVFVSIELVDGENNNDYQEKSMSISCAIEAVQGNAETEEVVTAPELAAILQNPVNGVVTLTKSYAVNDEWKSIYIPAGTIVNGNGHFISGLTTSLLNVNQGEVTFQNLTLKDSVMVPTDGTGTGCAAFIPAVNNVYATYTFTNCHLDNVTVQARSVEQDPYYLSQSGGFIGNATAKNITISNCSITNSSINGNSSAGGFIGYINRCEVEITNSGVSNSTFTSIDNGGWRVGALVGTVNGPKNTTFAACTESNSKFAMDYSTSENPNHGLFGRKLGTGKLVIDGVPT